MTKLWWLDVLRDVPFSLGLRWYINYSFFSKKTRIRGVICCNYWTILTNASKMIRTKFCWLYNPDFATGQLTPIQRIKKLETAIHSRLKDKIIHQKQYTSKLTDIPVSYKMMGLATRIQHKLLKLKSWCTNHNILPIILLRLNAFWLCFVQLNLTSPEIFSILQKPVIKNDQQSTICGIMLYWS